jgi:hypothetical protein
LLDILEYLGFPRSWRDWISCLLSNSSMKIILNGNPKERICHARGLRQGDPLSLILFLLTVEVLGALIRKPDDWSLLQPFSARLPHRASFYVDGLVLFITPSAADIHTTCCILSVFEEASRLGCNLAKYQNAADLVHG